MSCPFCILGQGYKTPKIITQKHPGLQFEYNADGKAPLFHIMELGWDLGSDWTPVSFWSHSVVDLMFGSSSCFKLVQFHSMHRQRILTTFSHTGEFILPSVTTSGRFRPSHCLHDDMQWPFFAPDAALSVLYTSIERFYAPPAVSPVSLTRSSVSGQIWTDGVWSRSSVERLCVIKMCRELWWWYQSAQPHHRLR